MQVTICGGWNRIPGLSHLKPEVDNLHFNIKILECHWFNTLILNVGMLAHAEDNTNR